MTPLFLSHCAAPPPNPSANPISSKFSPSISYHLQSIIWSKPSSSLITIITLMTKLSPCFLPFLCQPSGHSDSFKKCQLLSSFCPQLLVFFCLTQSKTPMFLSWPTQPSGIWASDTSLTAAPPHRPHPLHGAPAPAAPLLFLTPIKCTLASHLLHLWFPLFGVFFPPDDYLAFFLTPHVFPQTSS